MSLEARRAAIASARVALDDVSSVLADCAATDLQALLGEVDALVAAGAAARIAVTAAAVAQGVVRSSQTASVAAWVATHAPSQQPSGAGTIAALGVRVARGDELVDGAVGDAVLTGSLAPDAAMEVIAQADRLLPVVRDECAATVVDALVAMGVDQGRSGVRSVFPALLARFGRRDLQRDQDAAAKRVALSRALPDGAGTFLYKFTADPETKALLEAAIGPLSAPSPGRDGSRDERTLEQRRGQALREVCRRGSASARPATPPPPVRNAPNDGSSFLVPLAGPTTLSRDGGARWAPPGSGSGWADHWPATKATLIVTMTLDDLVSRIGAGRPMATWDQETILAPDSVRRIACEAGIIPVVLGRDGAVLDVGRQQRLFTIDQVRALWVRDGGCTFPGCVMPPLYCDAHHLRHWADHGATNLDNGTLLCPRHHDIVHRDRLIGHVRDARVVWDTEPGSYERDIGPPGDLALASREDAAPRDSRRAGPQRAGP